MKKKHIPRLGGLIEDRVGLVYARALCGRIAVFTQDEDRALSEARRAVVWSNESKREYGWQEWPEFSHYCIHCVEALKRDVEVRFVAEGWTFVP